MFKDFPFLLEEEEDVDLAEDDEPGQTPPFLIMKSPADLLTITAVKSISEIADQHLNSLPRAQAAEFASLFNIYLTPASR